MMKTLTAIGISAAIVFAPLAAIAQTNAAPAGAAPRPPMQRRRRRLDEEGSEEAHVQEAHGQENEEAGG